MLLLGFSKTDIDKFLEHVYELHKRSYLSNREFHKDMCKYKEFVNWLKTQNNN